MRKPSLYERASSSGRDMLTTNPFDDDKLHEECGIFGIWGAEKAASFFALPVAAGGLMLAAALCAALAPR